MLREVIHASKVTEIFKVSDEVKRGALVTKNAATGVASKADGNGVEVYIVDADIQPQGEYADLEISAYELDTVKANDLAVLVTYAVGGQFATDQVTGTFTVGDYAVASGGLFSPATTGQVSKFKYVGEYDDAGHVLHRFEVVDPHTVQ